MLLLQVGSRLLPLASDAAELDRRGIQCKRSESIEDAIALLGRYDFDAILVDLDLGGPPLHIIRRIRRVSKIPMVAIKSSPNPRMKIEALDLGVDDLQTQVYGVDEIIARIRVVVRRAGGHAESSLRCGRLELRTAQQKAYVDGVPIRMSRKEYMLLELLTLKSGSVVSKTTCLNHLYGIGEHPGPKVIDVVLHRIRKKLVPYNLGGLIANVWGCGFMLREQEAAKSPAFRAIGFAQDDAPFAASA